MSLKSTFWPNLLKMLPELLLSPFWLRRTLPVRPLAPTEASVWEHATSALGVAPVRWVLTAIGFSSVRCVRSAIGFLPIRRPLGAFGFSPVHCEGEYAAYSSPYSSSYLLKSSFEGNAQVSDGSPRWCMKTFGPLAVVGFESSCLMLGALRWPLFTP